MEGNFKPNLIEPQYLRKVFKSNNVEEYSILDNISCYSSNLFIYFIINYGDLLIAILILFIILYFRYKYFSNEKNITKNEVVVNYIRDQDILDGNVINTNDRIESKELLNDEIINKVKNEVKKVDSLQPYNNDQQFGSAY